MREHKRDDGLVRVQVLFRGPSDYRLMQAVLTEEEYRCLVELAGASGPAGGFRGRFATIPGTANIEMIKRITPHEGDP